MEKSGDAHDAKCHGYEKMWCKMTGTRHQLNPLAPIMWSFPFETVVMFGFDVWRKGIHFSGWVSKPTHQLPAQTTKLKDWNGAILSAKEYGANLFEV